MTVKARIDAAAGSVELEGDKEFVSAYLDKLLPMLQSVRKVGSALKPPTAVEPSGSSPEGPPPQPKKRRRGKFNPPQGTSCRTRILTLKEDGFFKNHQTPADIAKGLGTKGWTHNSNQVAAALVTMFKNQEIQRTKGTKGWTYYWDRG